MCSHNVVILDNEKHFILFSRGQPRIVLHAKVHEYVGPHMYMYTNIQAHSKTETVVVTKTIVL